MKVKGLVLVQNVKWNPNFNQNEPMRKQDYCFRHSVPLRNFPVDWPEKLCSTYIPTRISGNFFKNGRQLEYNYTTDLLKVVTLSSHINSAWQHVATTRNVSGNMHSNIMLFNLQCNIFVHCMKIQPVLLGIYAHLLAPVPAKDHHKPFHFANVQFQNISMPTPR